MNATAPWINTTTITTTSKQGKPTPIVNWGFAPLLIGATLLAALLSGTTLGIMSLDLTYLRVLSESGTTGERRRATAILRVRQHPNWLLCKSLFQQIALGHGVRHARGTLFTP